MVLRITRNSVSPSSSDEPCTDYVLYTPVVCDSVVQTDVGFVWGEGWRDQYIDMVTAGVQVMIARPVPWENGQRDSGVQTMQEHDDETECRLANDIPTGQPPRTLRLASRYDWRLVGLHWDRQAQWDVELPQPNPYFPFVHRVHRNLTPPKSSC